MFSRHMESGNESSSYVVKVLLFLILMCFVRFGDGVTYCPLRFPYAFNGGRYCCKYNEEKTGYDYRGDYQDEYCDGSELTSESKCCKDDQYNRCPGVTCQTPDFENDPCTEEYPYPYYHGLYCCRTAKEKVSFEHRPDGSACQNGLLTLKSECCENNDYTQCVNPPCVTMEYWSLTWNAEGNDNSNDADFSRKLRADPDRGVLLGRGFSMKNLNEHSIEATLIAIGLAEDVAATLSQGATKTDTDAVNFVTDNNGFTLTHKQQYKLFEKTVNDQIIKIKLILIRNTLQPSTSFDTRLPPIKGVLLDLHITGEYTNSVATSIHSAVADNDIAALKTMISDRSLFSSTPEIRFEMRKAYLERAELS